MALEETCGEVETGRPRELQAMTAESGPGASIEELVRENLGWLRGWFRGRVRDPDRVDDLCQESILKALENLPRLRDPSRFPAWLYRIAVNTLRDALRRDVRRGSLVRTAEDLEKVPAEGTTAQTAERREEAERLLAAIRELPETLREPLLLRHSRNLSYRQIGAILGIRENAVQVRIFRARQLLRKRLPDL